MKKIFLSFVLLVSIFATAQDVAWISTIGGSGYDFSNKVITDSSGNIFVTGVFVETVDFDPGVNTFNLTAESESDTYIQKLNSEGNFVWAISFDGNAIPFYRNSIAIDNEDNLYFYGNFIDTVDLDPSSNIFNLTPTNGESDTFFLKLDSDANFLWAKQLGGDTYYGAKDILVDSNNNMYTTGFFSNTVDFDLNAGVQNLTAVGDNDFFILKLSSTGEFIWVKSLEAEMEAFGSISVLDTENNLILCGDFEGPTDFDPGINDFIISPSGSRNQFILKLNENGDFVWVRSFGNGQVSSEFIRSATVDAIGDIYTTGGFFGTVDFDPSANEFILSSFSSAADIFIQKITKDGDFEWTKSFGGINSETNVGESIIFDNEDNLVVVGRFTDTIDFNPSSGTYNLISNGEKDSFIVSLSNQGEFSSAYSFGSILRDVGASITKDTSGNLITTGTFQDIADLNPGADVNNFTSNGDADIYTIKLNSLLLGTEENPFISNLKYYPNPTSGAFIVSLGQQYDTVYIEITNMLGQQIHQKTFYQNDSLEMEINAESGIYFCTLVLDGNQTETIKIIKE